MKNTHTQSVRASMPMTTTIALALCATTVGLTSCNRGPDFKGPAGAAPDLLAVEAYPNITVEPPLNRYIVTRGPIVDTSREIMRVIVPVRATTSKVEPNVQYRFLFFDANGVELRQQSGWRMLQLPRRTEMQLTGNALDNTATDWRLEIRSGR